MAQRQTDRRDRQLPFFADLTSIIALGGALCRPSLTQGKLLKVCTMENPDKSFISLKQPPKQSKFPELCMYTKPQAKEMELAVFKLTECMCLFTQPIFLGSPFCQSLCLRQTVGSPSDGPFAIREFTGWRRRWTGTHKRHKSMLSGR